MWQNSFQEPAYTNWLSGQPEDLEDEDCAFMVNGNGFQNKCEIFFLKKNYYPSPAATTFSGATTSASLTLGTTLGSTRSAKCLTQTSAEEELTWKKIHEAPVPSYAVDV